MDEEVEAQQRGGKRGNPTPIHRLLNSGCHKHIISGHPEGSKIRLSLNSQTYYMLL